MKLLLKHAEASQISGTSLVGYVRDTRRGLEELFGEPNIRNKGDGGGDGKTTTEWALRLDGMVFTIYDYKADNPPDLDELYEWHIGAHHEEVLNLIIFAYPQLDVEAD